MKTAIKVTGIIIGLILVSFIGRCFYMVACISCTSSPIKRYEFQGGIDDFEDRLKDFSTANPDVSFKFSRRDSADNENRTARDVTIEIVNKSSHLIYNLTYVETKPNEMTEVDLDEVYETHKVDANNTESREAKELLEDFKNKFLQRLKKDEQISLNPEFF